MVERRTGAIVNVSSVAGRNGGGLGATAYAAAKAGLIAFTKGLAKELAPHGIRVNAVAPGVIDTRYHQVFTSPENLRGMISTVPLGRAGTSEEVADAIAFLCGPESRYITGETIEVNGGMAMY
jgi:3-oxoacyl-[acyl-carrier protein] reductase